MKMIIEIPDKYVEALQVFNELGIDLGVEAEAILNGTPIHPWTNDKTAESLKRKAYDIYLQGSPEEPIGVILNEEDAHKYCERFSKPNSRQCAYYVETEILTPDTAESPWMDGYGTSEYKESKYPCEYPDNDGHYHCPYDANGSDGCRHYCGVGVDE